MSENIQFLPTGALKASKIVDDGPLTIGTLVVDHIQEKTAAHGVNIDNVLEVDHLNEASAAHGVMADVKLASAVSIDAPSVLKGGVTLGSYPIGAFTTAVDALTGLNLKSVSAVGAGAYGVQFQTGQFIGAMSFWLYKTGSPSGAVYMYHYTSSFKILLGAMANAASLTGSPVECIMGFEPIWVGVNEVIGLEFGGGDAGNYVMVDGNAGGGVRTLANCQTKGVAKTAWPAPLLSTDFINDSTTYNPHIKVVTRA
jgi:hypothetical protein